MTCEFLLFGVLRYPFFLFGHTALTFYDPPPQLSKKYANEISTKKAGEQWRKTWMYIF